MHWRDIEIPVSKLPDPDMQAAPAALVMAARRAHMIAHQTGTKVIVVQDGEVIAIDPDPGMYEGLDRKIYCGM